MNGAKVMMFVKACKRRLLFTNKMKKGDFLGLDFDFWLSDLVLG